MNTLEFIKEINALRLANKNKWYFWQGVVNGKKVEIKGYGTWLQIFRINGLNLWAGMDISIKDFKESLARVGN